MTPEAVALAVRAKCAEAVWPSTKPTLFAIEGAEATERVATADLSDIAPRAVQFQAVIAAAERLVGVVDHRPCESCSHRTCELVRAVNLLKLGAEGV